MKISLIKQDKIENFVLPPLIHGNYWITDKTKDQKDRNFINIIAENNKWKMISNYEVSIFDGDTYKESVILDINKFYVLKVEREEPVLLYTSSVYDTNTYQMMVKGDTTITIGSKESCEICFNNGYIESENARLVYKNNEWIVNGLSKSRHIYVNNEKVDTKKINNGDVIFIMGLKLIIIKNNIIINNIDKIKVNSSIFFGSRFPKQNIKEFEETDEVIPLYKDSDYFFKAPRFKSGGEKVIMNVDPAPQKEKEDKTPIIFVIGPMLTMGMTSMVTAFTAVNNVISGGRDLKEALPSLVIAGSMMLTMILWPLLTKRYQKKERKKNEENRKKKYSEYIEGKRVQVREIMKEQTTALIESYPPLEELKKTIMFKKTNLWEREIEHDDFLRLRIGIGSEPVNVDIKYPEEHFSMDEDDLRIILNNLVADSKILDNVPITISFTEKYISALVGETPIIEEISYGYILQLISYHSYDDLKLIFFTSETKKRFWDFAKTLPHCWSEDKTTRYFATNVDEMNQVSANLESVFQSRVYDDGNIEDYKAHKPYYFIITDNFKDAREIEIIKDVLDQKINVGFSLLILNDKLTNLPNECMDFICIGHNNRSVVFEDELVMNRQRKFISDIDESLNLNEFALKIANIPIDTVKSENSFPKSISFLEMYNVGKVEQLNSFNRWETNVPINSLQVPLGVDKQGNIFKLDLHEKFHGPHGLIAGMTGSGKSELIITYILSLAINYHPNEVSFIIIDYKGGGVAGAFYNKETGIKLPHIAGTITNLDTVEMNRSLVSIESELKRRQKEFNKAREISKEGTIDIYKYQKLYRSGVVDEPISHLFIICDEFAELKLQQPEFMDQLISTARIGRSLGVHLILATQKPSGVVDNQIWSNSRFRICLKVQEKEDSMEMIKRPDAAMIKNVGRFYLQVGYNEFFAEGLSAWCGEQYVPTDKPKRKIDTSINFLDNTGYTIKSINDDKKILNSLSLGEQLTNIVKYVTSVAKENNINVKQLWLDRIPDLIYVDDLNKKYSYKSEPYIINPIIGEYDDPSNQKQGLVTLNLSTGGNTIIYGSSGSGKSVLISSLIYSTIKDHSASEVNFYIMDFGSETFRMYIKAPQVGDVLLVNEQEKVSNLFKMLFSIIKERKKILFDYNGDFILYNKKNEKKLPLIIIIINNYESFYENYMEQEETFLQLTREGSRYGIVFVISVSGINSIRYKLKQNFKQEFVLQLNDEYDYSSILGNVNKVYPSKALGRGLLKMDKVYEFQTSHPYQQEQMTEHIKELCSTLKKESTIFAEQVAILPEIVTAEKINSKLQGLEMVPLGIEKKTLKVSNWDFSNNSTTIVSAIGFDDMKYFINPFIEQFNEISNCTVVVIDAAKESSSSMKNNNIFYYDNEFNKVMDSLYTNIKKQYDVYVQTNYNREILNKIKPVVCIVIGIESLLTKLNGDLLEKYYFIVKCSNIIKTIKIIFIDTIDVFKKLEYNEWYKGSVKNNQGVWIGNGISNQYSLKLAKLTRELQLDIPKGFGYVVKKGVPVLTKFLTDENGYEEVEYE